MSQGWTGQGGGGAGGVGEGGWGAGMEGRRIPGEEEVGGGVLVRGMEQVNRATRLLYTFRAGFSTKEMSVLYSYTIVHADLSLIIYTEMCLVQLTRQSSQHLPSEATFKINVCPSNGQVSFYVPTG